jgi:hypothetical protein
MNSELNGQPTKDPSGEEGRQEAQGPGNLQQQACADAGISSRKRDRIVYIENASNSRAPFIVKEVGTVAELIEGVCDRYPDICIQSIGMKVSSSRLGTIGRKMFTEQIPYEYDTLYISLYLLKHQF